MIIECPYCESKVDARVLTEHESTAIEQEILGFKTLLLECPICFNAILAGQELWQTGLKKTEWDDARRLWPPPEKYLDWKIPISVRNSLEEAKRCYKAKAYYACAVMCGKTLESICSEYGTKNKFLAGGLKELLDKQVIDKKIYDWSEALRKHRNIGAHATKEKISKQDAENLLDFANAICDYIFTLTKKFERFMKRKQKLEEE